MRVLVTGGAGFIGSHVVDGLVSQGHQTRVVDNLFRGSQKNLNPAAAFDQMDIRNPEVESLFQSWRPQVVIHQAALANVRESFQQPLEYAQVNFLGSLNLIELSRRYGTEKFVYASTGGAVYGEPEILPVREDHPIRPLDPYGASKHHVEHHLFLTKANFGLDYTVLRYPNVYGPRQDPHGEAGVIAIFTRAMLDGRQPVINGDGLQERDFVFVEDIVRANLAALTLGSGGVFNLGAGRPVNINQVFQILRDKTGFQGEENHGPAKGGEVRSIFLDAGRAFRDLGWSARVSLDDGCARTVDWFRQSHLNDG